MSTKTFKMVLTGPYAGHTRVLNGIHFKDGVAEIQGSIGSMQGIIRYLGTCYQAYLENSSELHDAQEADKARAEGREPAKRVVETAEVKETKTEIEIANKDPVAETNDKLVEAVMALDPMNDEHWTMDGKPRMDAVEATYGSADIKRADIDAAAPGYDRNAALEKAAAAPQV